MQQSGRLIAVEWKEAISSPCLNLTIAINNHYRENEIQPRRLPLVPKEESVFLLWQENAFERVFRFPCRLVYSSSHRLSVGR